MRRAFALVGVGAVLAAGAASAAVGSFHRHQIPGYGISLALPSPWKAVNYREILKPGVLTALARDNPELAGSFATMAQPNSPIKFFAYDPQVASGFATNVNLVIAPLRTPLTFAQYQRELINELRGVSSVSGLRYTAVRLPGGQAVRVSYRLRVNLQGRVITVQTLQYGFLSRLRSVVVTFTTLPSSAKFYSSVFATSARSIRLS